MEKSWNFRNKFLILTNLHCYGAAFQNPTDVFVNYRAWQINEINDVLINPCKLGPGLMRINDGLMRTNGALTFRH